MVALFLIIFAGWVQNVLSTTTTLSMPPYILTEILFLIDFLEYTQTIPSDQCGGCQVGVQYNYFTATVANNTEKGVLYVQPMRYIAQIIQKQDSQCIPDLGSPVSLGFPVNLGGSETMTISTKVNSAGVSGAASMAISQMLGSDLCITTAYSTISPTSRATLNPLPASTPSVVQAKPTSESLRSSNPTSGTSDLDAKNSTSHTLKPEVMTTVTRPATSSSDAIPQPALSPKSNDKDNNQKLQIIAGVLTSVLGVAAIALAILLWRRYRLLRRGSSSTVDSFFRPKPEQHEGYQAPGSVAKDSVSTATMTEKKDASELAGDTGSMDVRWRETYYEERKTIPQELKGTEPPRFEMDTRNSRGPTCSISPLTP